MLITELKNRDEAKAFLSALRGASTTDGTQRPYAAHLIFLVTGLELDQANILLDTLNDLDVVSGPYVACHVLVDRIKASANTHLMGIQGQETIETEFTIRQIEGLCNANSLNHIEMEELTARNLTSSNEHIARSLGIVEKLPCVLVIDSSEITSSGEFVILPFPNDRKELSQFIRKLVGIVASLEGEFKDQSRILEILHPLFDQRTLLRTMLGAPISHKLKALNQILRDDINNSTLVYKNLKRVKKSLGIHVNISKSQIACLTKVSEFNISEIETKEKLTNRMIKELNILIKTEFEVTNDFPTDVKTIEDLSQLRELVIKDILQGVVNEHKDFSESLIEIDDEIKTQRDLIVKGSSLVKIIQKDARFSASKKVATEAFGTILKSGLSDVAKPSFWLKILGL